MRVTAIDVFPVRVPYRHTERSSLITRAGIVEVIVRLTTDDGLVGWGECTRAADVAGVESAVRAMAPLVLGRDPWEKESIHRDVFVSGLWDLQPMTGNFAYAGIDMALWDLCGKASGQPLFRLFGGAMRERVEYFYYLSWSDADDVASQAQTGVDAGYEIFYLKVGIDSRTEFEMLQALRHTIGAGRRIRIDANQAWRLPDAVRILRHWHERFDLDFVEAPVPIEPPQLMRELRAAVRVPLCVNEGLGREVDAYRIIKSRCADYLCFSCYWVGSQRQLLTLVHAADLEGWQVCKHTHGELGLAAAAGQHMMLAAPNACRGHQQTAQMIADDILTEPLPIATGPSWGRIEGAGLGVEVNEDKVGRYHEDYRRHGQFPPYGDSFEQRPRD